MNTFKIKNKILFKVVTMMFLLVSLVPHVLDASILSTLNPDTKKCKYIENSEYQLFSNINTNFAAFKALGLVSKGECLKVVGSINSFFAAFFRIFIGIASVAAIINIAYAGIKTMLSESGVVGKNEWKKSVRASLEGLLIALTAWLLLSTINDRTLKNGLNMGTLSGVGAGISAGQNAAIVQALTDAQFREYQNQLIQEGGGGQITPGTGDVNGAFSYGQTTIFGYIDGNGKTGNEGDNGIGNSKWSHIPGYAHYTGDPRSQVLAMPRNRLLSDFGDADSVKRSGYEVFDGNRSLGVFPVGDESALKPDMSFGIVKNVLLQPVVDSNSWSSTNMRFKPLKNYFDTHPRPSNPMIRDLPGIENKSPKEVAAMIKSGAVDVIWR